MEVETKQKAEGRSLQALAGVPTFGKSQVSAEEGPSRGAVPARVRFWVVLAHTFINPRT